MIDWEQLKPNPEAMRMAKGLETALILAAVPGGDVAPAIAIAGQMVEQQLVGSPRGQMLAMALTSLITRYRETYNKSTLDPYSALLERLVRIGACTRTDVQHAALGQILNVGLAQGWLEAEFYDLLASVAGNNQTYLALLSRIERR